jgi:hypothetical protein
VYCKETPKHKQRQGYHTMVHQNGGYCIVCNAGAEVERMLSTSTAVPVTANINNSIPQLSNIVAGMSGLNLAPPVLKARYVKEVGIFSVLNV